MVVIILGLALGYFLPISTVLINRRFARFLQRRVWGGAIPADEGYLQDPSDTNLKAKVEETLSAIHAAISMTDREGGPQGDGRSPSRRCGKTALAAAVLRSQDPPAQKKPPFLLSSLIPLKRKASFGEEDDEAAQDCDQPSKAAALGKTMRNETRSRVVPRGTHFQRTFRVFEQRATDLERSFYEWLNPRCMSLPTICPECIEIDYSAAGEETLLCMADPALWWSYRRRLFIHDTYQKSKSHMYHEFFGDKLLSAMCITYLD